MRLSVFEDFAVRDLEPLTLTRPAFDLRCGAASLLERQASACSPRQVGALVRQDLEGLCRLNYPGLVVNDLAWLSEPGLVLVNARWLAPLRAPDLTAPVVGMVGEQVAFVALPQGTRLDGSPDGLAEHLADWKQTLPCVPAGGSMIDAPWDLVERNGEALAQDCFRWRATRSFQADLQGLMLIGPRDQLLVDPSAQIEPLVLVDTTRGPVLIDRGAMVKAFTRLEGPCYIGAGTQVFAGRICGSSIGPQCRVGGEIEESILHGYSNKRHDGFLGHSYVGEWVNFGAGTQTSDLRNDYGTINMEVGGVLRNTGRVKLGAFVGDHARTGIGTLLNTGTSVGPFSQLLPWGSLLPRRIPAFAQFGHGQLRERTDLRDIMTTAAKVMERRGCTWTEIHTECFFSLFESTTRQRKQSLREAEQARLRRSV